MYIQTLQHLKLIQIYHQIYYRLKKYFGEKKYPKKPFQVVAPLKIKDDLFTNTSYRKKSEFEFLNLKKEFSKIDWNFSTFGKLWTYNLNYFEFLHQKGITKEEGLELIKNFISNRGNIKDGHEPYPISLRGINWIKFLSKNKITDHDINNFLYTDYLKLTNNLEYHLLANHLLENGFSLLFGAYYFQDDHLYAKAKKILVQQLTEQILPDGAHYELSPMYHQIILHRILDSINLVKNNHWKKKELLSLLQKKAEVMLGWLEQISFNNGEIPKVNDSSSGIAPTTGELEEYAARLGIETKKVKLKESGYRKFNFKDIEVVIDVGQIAPKYQPGHSHADSLQFLLNFKNKPVIVDTGISTYEKNERRHLERSTASHNTITVNDISSSKVWGGFRVAKRAKVTTTKDSLQEIKASHDGYRGLGIIHDRRFLIQDSNLFIEDNLLTKSSKKYEAKGHLHFHPDVQIEITENTVTINKLLMLELSGIVKLEVKEYQFAEGFNILRSANKIEYTIKNNAALKFHAAISA